MARRPAGVLSEPYEQLSRAADVSLLSQETADSILKLIVTALEFLISECLVVDLLSKVPGKQYISFATKRAPNALSRPVNRALFLPDFAEVTQQWKEWSEGSHEGQGTERLSYTMATAFAAASDLFDRNNKKGPATYFEDLVGHLFARSLAINPTKSVALQVEGRARRMTMDFLFDVGEGRPAIHLPVKTSTRERVVQAWAHQRILDNAYGFAKYRGILVIHSETKLDSQKREVQEICVPDQWLVYQRYLAHMDRIYYFDIPVRYQRLADEYPNDIPLKHFSAFFSEKEAVLAQPLI